MQSKNFVFEIGVEEIPAQYVDEMAQSFCQTIDSIFKENLLDFKKVEVKYSPRRLVAFVQELNGEQSIKSEFIKGPSLDRAYDEEHNPTPALIGFLKSKNAKLEDIIIKELNGANYVYVNVCNIPRPTMEILPQILPQIINKIYLPNAMRWADYNIKFVRPIRWILAVFGDNIVDFNIECCKSGNFTMGHRSLSNKKIIVDNADKYCEILKSNYVILDQNERQNIILSQIKEIEKKFNCTVSVDDDLLDEIVNLIEYPTCGVGNFPEQFLKLPDPVVITPMKDHQRYFPVYKDGKLANMFVFVRNGNSNFMDKVAHGNERVLIARLKDGEFFYNEDIKSNLDEFAKKLDQVVYQEKLGTMVDKSNRVNKIAKYIAQIVGYNEIEKIDATTKIFKADLVSKVVNEFSELQGIMGAIYAKNQGLDKDIATAIGEQYLPISAGGQLPQTALGSIIAIADKLDSIMGLNAVGLMGKGSNDPYGMRRQAFGILAMQQKFYYNFDFKKIITDSAPIYQEFLNKTGVDIKKFIADLCQFFANRIQGILVDEKNIDHTILDQISFDNLNLFDILKKVDVLKSINQLDWFNDVRQSFLRIEKILKNKVPAGNIQEKLFDCDDEKKLYSEYREILDTYNNHYNRQEYEMALKALQKLSNLINVFFDNNLVMSQNKEVCDNRVVMLSEILKMYTNIFVLI